MLVAPCGGGTGLGRGRIGGPGARWWPSSRARSPANGMDDSEGLGSPQGLRRTLEGRCDSDRRMDSDAARSIARCPRVPVVYASLATRNEPEPFARTVRLRPGTAGREPAGPTGLRGTDGPCARGTDHIGAGHPLMAREPGPGPRPWPTRGLTACEPWGTDPACWPGPNGLCAAGTLTRMARGALTACEPGY